VYKTFGAFSQLKIPKFLSISAKSVYTHSCVLKLLGVNTGAILSGNT